ncbi:hypothetical protein Nepgr_012199 [Nepenthes gracilis]|uniref:Uncharacterized protein n=1 Tax=Nepenthes gracilis TaxID=150966 RepID=A0AAD3SFL9_NEPGR|nr:hypothetical protein Nepgr_012199 [Nepenthes gracilis]
MSIVKLGLIEGDFRMSSIVVDLHGFDVGGGGLAKRTLQFRVAAFVDAGTVCEPRLAAAPAGGCRVYFGGDFLGRVLLRLRLSSHGDLLLLSLCKVKPIRIDALKN